MKLGKLGDGQQIYIPWMQATYVMVAQQAGAAVPAGRRRRQRADLRPARATGRRPSQDKTGKRVLGFPAGPKGLMHRFFQGFLYPSYTAAWSRRSVAAEAEAMWTEFKAVADGEPELDQL